MATAPTNAHPSAQEGFSTAQLAETVISSHRGVHPLRAIRDHWRYRDLLRAFVARDIKVRYKQTVLGVVWVVLQPLMTGGLLAVIFTRLRAAQGGQFMDDEAGFIFKLAFFMAALVPWINFSLSVTTSSTSLVAGANLISKVFFPRILVPSGCICAAVFDYCVTFTLFLVISTLAGAFSPWMLVAMPGLLLIQAATAAGLGYMLTSLHAQYRDVSYLMPFILQLGLFLTVMPIGIWPDWIAAPLTFSPMTAVVETYRALLNDVRPDFALLARGASVAVALLFAGLWVFLKREPKLVDTL